MADNKSSLLSKLFGGKEKDAGVDNLLKQLSALLDAQGVATKEYTAALTTLHEKGMLEDLQAAVVKMIDERGEESAEETANKVLAAVMGALAQEPAVEEDMTDEDEDEIEEDGYEDKEYVRISRSDLEAFVKELGQSRDAAVEDSDDLFESLVETTKALKNVVEQNDAFEGRLDAVINRLEKVEKAQKARPRSVTQATETAVDEEAAKEVEKENAVPKVGPFGLKLKDD